MPTGTIPERCGIAARAKSGASAAIRRADHILRSSTTTNQATRRGTAAIATFPARSRMKLKHGGNPVAPLAQPWQGCHADAIKWPGSTHSVHLSRYRINQTPYAP
jgi:hypothetical protein